MEQSLGNCVICSNVDGIKSRRTPSYYPQGTTLFHAHRKCESAVQQGDVLALDILAHRAKEILGLDINDTAFWGVEKQLVLHKWFTEVCKPVGDFFHCLWEVSKPEDQIQESLPNVGHAWIVNLNKLLQQVECPPLGTFGNFTSFLSTLKIQVLRWQNILSKNKQKLFSTYNLDSPLILPVLCLICKEKVAVISYYMQLFQLPNQFLNMPERMDVFGSLQDMSIPASSLDVYTAIGRSKNKMMQLQYKVQYHASGKAPEKSSQMPPLTAENIIVLFQAAKHYGLSVW